MSDKNLTERAIDYIKEGKPLPVVLEKAKLPSLGTYLFEFICRKNLSVQVTAELSDLNKASLHKILNGDMHPSSNVLIRLSRTLDMDIDETQKLLKCGSCASLSGSRPRDCYIMDGIIHKRDIAEIDEMLIHHGFQGILSKK